MKCTINDFPLAVQLGSKPSLIPMELAKKSIRANESFHYECKVKVGLVVLL